MQSELVSVITPCYNTGKYLSRLLNSVLEQSYPHIEMIAVDDGSTDNTAEVIKGFIGKFEQKGYSLVYVKQENSGQSVAIQRGLDMINGEYLVWPDSDDYYASADAITKMVARFKDSPEDVAMVRTQEVMVEDADIHHPICVKGARAREYEHKDLFEDCLLGKNAFFYCPGAYMAKYQSFIKSSKLPIYTSKDAGQNWQLMLPLLYHYRCSTILEPLYHVVCRGNSHSREKKEYSRLKQRIETYRDTILCTLKNIVGMPATELEHYTHIIENKYTKELLNAAIVNKQKGEAQEFYCNLQRNKAIDVSLRIRYFLFKHNANWVWRYSYGVIAKLKGLLHF